MKIHFIQFNLFINQMVLVELCSIEPMHKNIKKFKRIQTKKRFHISWVLLHENATNVFNKVPIYPCKFTSSIKWFYFNSTKLNWCLKTLKNVKEFNQRNVSIFLEYTFTKTQLMFLTKCQVIHANSLHQSHGFGWTLQYWNQCLKTSKNWIEFKQRNVSIFSWVHIYKNTTNVF